MTMALSMRISATVIFPKNHLSMLQLDAKSVVEQIERRK